MRTKLYYTGLNQGWAWGLEYATGTRVERREIWRKIRRMKDEFYRYGWFEGIEQGFNEACEARAENILSGIAPRTINPHKLAKCFARMIAE